MPRHKPTKASDARLQAVSRMEAFKTKYNLNWVGLSLVLGITPATTSQWKAGRSYPSETIVNFLHVLEGSAEARELAGVNRWRLKRKRADKPKSSVKPSVAKNANKPVEVRAAQVLPLERLEEKQPQPVAPVPELASDRFDIERFLEGSMGVWHTRRSATDG